MTVSGLTFREVEERKARNEVNSVEPVVSRSYKDIVIKNVCTTFNLLILIVGVALLVLNEPINALAATAVIMMNIFIATIQEMKAKRRLDKIALLMRPKVTVLRDGIESDIDQNEIVKDDVIVLKPGDQALVDGIVIEKEYLEMDESLLTGESRTVRKNVDDTVYSGSYCITGKGYYKVTAFGEESFASKMLASARKFNNKNSPLQIETAAVTKLLMSIAFLFFVFLLISNLIKFHNPDLIRSNVVLNSVIILDIVPIALFLLIVISYMVAAIRMADGGVLLQRSNAVESMSHVNTVCMDKTGTITTNKLLFAEMHTYIDVEEAKELVTIYANATGGVNRTIEAILRTFGKTDVKAIDEIRFSSDRKFSAVKVEYRGKIITLYLGADTSIGRYMDRDVSKAIENYSSMGLRTVVLALGDDVEFYKDDIAQIPELRTVAVVAIKDEVRADCRKTIGMFLDEGIDIKVISGDDPATVDSMFTIAKIPGERHLLSGDQLDSLKGRERTEAILRTNIFGRMKPDHKEMIIETLKNEGRYVAMVGDGVNDVKSLKMANIGVALQSGSGAARGVADMILVNDNFSALPKAIMEGRRTVSGMRDILKIYLSRNFILAFLVFFIMFVFASAFEHGATPFLPTQATFYAMVSVSVAAFLMTLWAQPDENNGSVLPEVLRYAIPTAVIASIMGLTVYIVFYLLTIDGSINNNYSELQMLLLGWPSFKENELAQMLSFYGVDSISKIPIERVAEINARNAMLLFCILEGITQIFMITPHWKIFSPDGKLHKDIRPTILIFILYGIVFGAYMFATTNNGFLKWLPVSVFPIEYTLLIIGFVALWFVINLHCIRSGKLNFVTEMTDRWYRKKLDKVYSQSKLGEQGIEENPVMEIANILKTTNDRIVSKTRNAKEKEDDKDRD